jgi:lysophospholipase L1-like esterase
MITHNHRQPNTRQTPPSPLRSEHRVRVQSRTKRLVGAVVALGLLAVLATAGNDPTPAGGNRLLVVGDSLTALTRNNVASVLRDAGWDPTIDAESGTTIENWAPRLPDIVTFTHPDVVIIELGTNDCDVKGCPDLAPVIDGVMRTLADIKNVLWVNVQDDTFYPKHADYVNFAIEAADARWPNMFTVDLASRMRGHPEWRADGLHFNTTGAFQYASLLVDALREFAPSP